MSELLDGPQADGLKRYREFAGLSPWLAAESRDITTWPCSDAPWRW